MPKQTIAEKAAKLICEHADNTRHPIRPPIPVEEIIEITLDLSLDYGDLDCRYGVKGILGATDVPGRTIAVNKRLLDDRKMEGRLSFTCAHEAGHWVLHRHLVNAASRVGNNHPAILCRIADARASIEWQANYFASCLLMPERETKDAFSRVFSASALEVHNVRGCFEGPICFDPAVENWHRIAESVQAVGNFSNVSMQAMIIRLQDLGLVVNKTSRMMGWRKALA